MTKLEELDLSYNRIVDISPLTGLTQLTELSLQGNEIVDVSPLEPLMAQLRDLNLYQNRISDFSPIGAYLPQHNGEFINSRRYGIAYQNLDQPDRVVDIPDAGLRAALEAALDKESDAPIMRTEIESLTSLDASNRGIRNPGALYYATNLTSLNLTDNEITDTLNLRHLTQLVRLELAGNKLTGANLKNLTQLQYLDISRNLIFNVHALSLPTRSSLTTLNVAGNHIADVSPLATMTHLNALYLSNNPDTDYSAFAALLPTLDNADFSYDPGIEIPDANLRVAIEAALDKTAGETITQADMETLRRLDASSAGIIDLTGLEYAINLQRLNLARNRISDVSALSGLTNLRRLDLRRNRISDFSAIAGITTDVIERVRPPEGSLSDTPEEMPSFAEIETLPESFETQFLEALETEIPAFPTDAGLETVLWERFSPERFGSAKQTLRRYGPEEGLRRLRASDPEVATHIQRFLRRDDTPAD